MGWHVGLKCNGSGCNPLSAPYVLWDTRQWRSGGEGNGLRALPNLGSGGPMWDLDVVKRDFSGEVLTICGHNNLDWATSPLIPWSSIGGTPCDGGAITLMTAFGEFPVLGNEYAEIDMLFAYGRYVQSYGLTQSIGFLESSPYTNSPAGSTFTSVFHENQTFGFGAYNQWNPSDDARITANSADTQLRNRLIAVTLDSKLNLCHKCYSNMTEIPEQENNPGQQEFYVSTHLEDDCTEYDGDVYLDTHHFFYLGEDKRAAPGAQPGTPFQSVVGAGLFRGVPSQGDMQRWYDYFYGPAPTPLPAFVSPFPYTGGLSRWTDGTYAYHEFSGTAGGGTFAPVVGMTLPSTIDFWLIGGGGGGCGFQTPGGGGGGGGGQVREVLGVAAPVTSQTFVQGAGGASRTNGGASTFMGYTANGGRGSTSHVGGLNGDLVTPGGTRLAAERAGGGGGGAGGAGQNAAGTTAGKGGLGALIPAVGGGTMRWAAGGHAGGNTGTLITTPSGLTETGGQSGTSSPTVNPIRGGGGGGRLSSSTASGFSGAVGGLVIRYLLP